MRDRKSGGITPSLVFALAITTAGVVMLLDRLGLVRARDYLRWWPAALVILGVAKLVQGGGTVSRIWGGFLTLAGTGLLLDRLGYLRFRFDDMWPLGLVAIGVTMLWRALLRSNEQPPKINSVSVLKDWAVFGGVERKIDARDFRGGEVLAVFGGCDIDLRQAGMNGNAIVIDANAMFGGVEMKVPESWSVSIEGVGIFGGYADSTTHPKHDNETSTRRLIVRGFAMFGGVEVKN